MNRRLVAVALAVVLVGGSVAALVADPLASPPEPEPVDATAEPPGEFVLAALETPERRSYDLRYAFQHSSDEEPHVTHRRVDRAHHRAVVSHRRGADGEPYAQWFLGECNSAERVGTDARVDNKEYGYFADPFHIGAVEPTDLDARVVDRTDDRVVVRVTNPSAAASLVFDLENPREWVREDEVRGNLTVVWDADDGVVDRVEYVQSSRVNETHRATFRQHWDFREWGQVHVDRPGWAGYTHHEFLCDVTTFRT